jgi:hypothetical protein
VEELISGQIRSPSVQMRIHPGGRPLVLSTHDQVLGGELQQTFVGCRFPAEQAYAASIVREARKAGDYLATRRLTGSFGVDFIVTRRDAVWQPYAVEINLREGDTSHPFGTLRLLTNGSLDRAKTTCRTRYGQKEFYSCHRQTRASRLPQVRVQEVPRCGNRRRARLARYRSDSYSGTEEAEVKRCNVTGLSS